MSYGCPWYISFFSRNYFHYNSSITHKIAECRLSINQTFFWLNKKASISKKNIVSISLLYFVYCCFCCCCLFVRMSQLWYMVVVVSWLFPGVKQWLPWLDLVLFPLGEGRGSQEMENMEGLRDLRSWIQICYKNYANQYKHLLLPSSLLHPCTHTQGIFGPLACVSTKHRLARSMWPHHTKTGQS